MEINLLIFILLILCFIAATLLIIIVVNTNKQENVDYNKIIKYLNCQKEKNLKTLMEGNKIINKLEKEILKCKKQLNMKLFDNK